ncbi:MAG TPA: hypothetical protein VGF15_05695 [Solirubrobacteraceae bacterium]|jgi:hypothetical protein
MKPSLRTIVEHRPRQRRTAGARRTSRLARAQPRTLTPAVEPPQASTARGTPDFALERARAAGGPLDEASYSCQCGCLFEASVSTTVVCPHCGASQAW